MNVLRPTRRASRIRSLLLAFLSHYWLLPSLLAHSLLVSFVNERFSWNWYYYYLTNEGIDYLQKFLNLPADVVPATLKKSNRPASRPSAEGGRGGKGGYRGDDGYRRGGFGDKAGPGGDFRPSYGGGRGGGF